jgi:hypothetical protein
MARDFAMIQSKLFGTCDLREGDSIASSTPVCCSRDGFIADRERMFDRSVLNR